MAQQHLDFGTAVGRDSPTLQKIEENFGELYAAAQTGLVGAVTVAGQSEALVLNDSSPGARAANKTRIQAAIDYAHNNARQVTNVSAGRIFYDPPLYVDAPGNLRTNLANPTIFNQSLHLKGAGGIGTRENHGTILRVLDNTGPAVILGTGQGVKISELAVLGPSVATSRAALPANGIGIGLAGGNGGLSRATLDGVAVQNFREGVVTGFNRDALCDSVTMLKCHVTDCYRGVHFSKTQNYINSLYDCTFGDNTTHVYSPVSKAVNIFGGNYSAVNANRKAFTIGSTSALSAFTDSIPGGTFQNWSFTTTLAADDQPMRDGAYDAFVIKTVGFGVVALNLTGYDTGTRVATFKLDPWWLTSHFNHSSDLVTLTDLQTELQAATTLYACETVTLFQGQCFNVQGIHVENPGALTRLYFESTVFAGDTISHFNRVTLNHNVDQREFASGTEDQKAVFYCQQAFPFIRFNDAGTQSVMLSNTVSQNDTDRIVIDHRAGVNRIVAQNCGLKPNIRSAVGAGGAVGFDGFLSETVYGVGEWDSTPFLPANLGTNGLAAHHASRHIGHVPFLGHFPVPYATPGLLASQLADIENGLGAIGTYPVLVGDTPYRVLNLTGPSGGFGSTGATASQWVKSNHKGFSYGQDLTIDWSYKGQSWVVTMSDLSRMFAGLAIILNNGVDGDQTHIVTGVYLTLGYVTVWPRLVGTKTTTFTGSTVKQEPYSFVRTGMIQ